MKNVLMNVTLDLAEPNQWFEGKNPFFAKKANFSYSKRMEFSQRPVSPAKIPLKKYENFSRVRLT